LLHKIRWYQYMLRFGVNLRSTVSKPGQDFGVRHNDPDSFENAQ